MPNLRPCAGYPGYSVDDTGDVYSHLSRRGLAGGGVRVVVDPERCRPLSQEPDKWGYWRVRLHKDGRRVWARVNVLVCTAFGGPAPSEDLHCRHLDGDKNNNADWNLAWGTAAENAADRLEHGTVPSGCDHPFAKFSPLDVVDILAEYEAGMEPKLIAAVRCVSIGAIRDLVAGRTYKQFSRA